MILLVSSSICVPFLIVATHYYAPYISKIRKFREKIKKVIEQE